MLYLDTLNIKFWIRSFFWDCVRMNVLISAVKVRSEVKFGMKVPLCYTKTHLILNFEFPDQSLGNLAERRISM